VVALEDSGAAEGACPLAGEAHAPTGVSVGGTMGCSRRRRRRNGRSLDIVRLIRSMLTIIPKFYLNLEVDDPLDVGCIDHILCPMC
jgi:hypothetical protein